MEDIKYYSYEIYLLIILKNIEGELTMNKINKSFIILVCLMSTLIIASGSADLDIDPFGVQDVPKGSTFIYNVTLNGTDSTDILHWYSNDSNLTVRMREIPGGLWTDYNQSGNINFTYSGGNIPKYFELETFPDVNMPNKRVDITVWGYETPMGIAKAAVTGSVNVTPELSTIALMSAGLLGLIGLIRWQRKH